MKTTCIAAALLGCALSAPTLAQQADHRLGDHPAIVVQRLVAQQGYDYVSKFYPHPARLYLLPEAPRPMMDHPAVMVWEREQQHKLALARAAPPSVAQAGERR